MSCKKKTRGSYRCGRTSLQVESSAEVDEVISKAGTAVVEEVISKAVTAVWMSDSEHLQSRSLLLPLLPSDPNPPARLTLEVYVGAVNSRSTRSAPLTRDVPLSLVFILSPPLKLLRNKMCSRA